MRVHACSLAHTHTHILSLSLSHECTRTYAHAHTHMHMHARAHTHTHTSVGSPACPHAQSHRHPRTRMYTCTYTCSHVHACRMQHTHATHAQLWLIVGLARGNQRVAALPVFGRCLSRIKLPRLARVWLEKQSGKQTEMLTRLVMSTQAGGGGSRGGGGLPWIDGTWRFPCHVM